MRRYVIALYIRLSVDDKITESLSIINQRKLLNSFASEIDEKFDIEILEFVDNGYSGTNFERPAFQELLSRVRNCEIDCIIVKDFSRFGRNILEVGYFTEKVFPAYNTRFISVADNFDSNKYKNDTGGIGVAFQYLVNEYYSRDLSQKVKSSVHMKMKKGEYKASFSPFGYKKGMDGRLMIDEEMASVVRLIFELALKGDKITEIPKVLNERRIPTPSKFKKNGDVKLYSNSKAVQLWTLQSVKQILKNESYIGTFVGQKYKTKVVGGKAIPNYDKDEYIKIDNNHPKIIDKETFYKVQEKIVTGKSRVIARNDYLLKGKVKCGICKHSMDRVNKVKVFKCRYTMHQEGYDCVGLKILEKELEEIIFELIKKQLEVILGNIDKKKSGFININNYETKILEAEKEKMKSYEKFVRGEIDINDYKIEKNILSEKINEIKVILKRLDSQLKLESANKKNGCVEKNLITEKISASIVDALIDKIFVYPNKKIEVFWKYREFIEIN